MKVMKISSLITGYRSELGLTPEDLAKYAGICKTGFYQKMKNWTLWRLGELNSIYDLLKIPMEERIYVEK